GGGYLNFMGNEFGHPEWIDSPRAGNAWSYHHARRQWHLADDPGLKYGLLGRFDRQMIALFKKAALLEGGDPQLLWEHDQDKVLAFTRGGWIFAFNFHPAQSFFGYGIPSPGGAYRMVLDTDDRRFGGHGRLTPDQVHRTAADGSNPWGTRISLYLPSRTGIVLRPRSSVDGEGT
ncbi:MAG TPA: alpha amylase C-terminal domain-containing protein, partial [Desulfosarcina sp.]|nr:alpha amylase C-terminal domain-containing protein [Desulfosarcina sp.]